LVGGGTGGGDKENKRSVGASQSILLPALATGAGEARKSPRVTYDEYLFFSGDELDKVDVGVNRKS
jgi:hypothetical protein